MFYAHFVLSKKGPLAKIWLAAHWDKKLTKAHIFETDIENSVEAIIQPKVKLALRTSGHLLLGVVRIYSRKTQYLLADCNEALIKVKMAFRPGMVDLPEYNREAAVSAITLAENFYEFDNMMVDMVEFELPPQYNVNQSRPEDITMQEVVREASFIDDGFGDGYDGFGFGGIPLDDPLYIQSVKPVQENVDGDGSVEMITAEPGITSMDVDSDKEVENAETDQRDDLTLEVPLPPVEPMADDDLSDYEGPAGVEDDDDDYPLPKAPETDVQEPSALDDNDLVDRSNGLFEEPESVVEPPQPAVDAVQSPQPPRADDITLYDRIEDHQDPEGQPAPEQPTIIGVDQTTLITNEAEAFALMPIDVTTVGTERKAKKKRKLIVDEVKAISSEAMKIQLVNGADLIAPLDLAPPSKKLMLWKECGGVDKLMILPGRNLLQKSLCQLYVINLVTRPCADEEEEEVVKPVKETKKQKKAAEEEKAAESPRETRRQKRLADSEDIAESPRETRRLKRSEKIELASQNKQSGATDNNAEVEVSALSDIERPRDDVSFASSRAVLNEDFLPGNLQLSTSAIDDTLTNITHDHNPDESLARIAPSELAIPEPRMPSLSFGDLSLPPIELAIEDPQTPRPADEFLSTSIIEPRSHMSDWAAGVEDDLDESIFNENAHNASKNGDAEEPLLEGLEENEEDVHLSNKRANQMLQMLGRSFRTRDSVGTKELFAQNNRKQVASKFYTLLVLKKIKAVDVCQTLPYGDIVITKGTLFNTPR